ncbi:MAG: hypothetical protein GY861_07910, partial [bacterium]|nr:hypothetical protein [bacterium]
MEGAEITQQSGPTRRVRFGLDNQASLSPIPPVLSAPRSRSTPQRAEMEAATSSTPSSSSSYSFRPELSTTRTRSTFPTTPTLPSSSSRSSSALRFPMRSFASAAVSANTYEELFKSTLPQNYQKSAMEVLKAIESVDPNLMSINNRQEILIKNQPTIHLVQLLKTLNRTAPRDAPNLSTAPSIQRVMGLLAKEMELSSATINNPAIRRYF